MQVVGRPGDDALVLRRRAGCSSEADLAFAFTLADAADAVDVRRFRALDLRVETKPDLSPVSEADRAAEEAIRALVAVVGPRRGCARRGVRRRRRRREVDRRSDRRDDELRARRPGVGDAARARARRCGGWSSLVSAPALGRRWWAVRGEGAFADGRGAVCRRSSRVEDATVSTTSAQADAGRLVGARGARVGESRASATSGSTASSPRARSTSRATGSLNVWDYVAVQLIVEESRRPRHDASPASHRSATTSFVTTNGALHDEVIALLADVDPGSDAGLTLETRCATNDAAPVVTAVVRTRVATLESLETAAQSRFLDAKQQVVVRRHERVLEQRPIAVARSGLQGGRRRASRSTSSRNSVMPSRAFALTWYVAPSSSNAERVASRSRVRDDASERASVRRSRVANVVHSDVTLT